MMSTPSTRVSRPYGRDTVSDRGRFERWLDRHNHKMELLRTLTSMIAAVSSTLVLMMI